MQMINQLSGIELSPSYPESFQKDMNSTFSSESFSCEALPNYSLPLQIPKIVSTIFSKEPVSQTFSAKITQKAVSWLITVAWTKNYCLQTCWTALLLFYGFKVSKVISKTQLESLLLVCLQLASKIHESYPLKTSELFLSSTHPVCRDVLASFEQELLELFDYNLYTSHTLEMVASHSHLDEESIHQVLFLSELYLSKDHTLFFDKERMSGLIELVRKFPVEGKEQQLQQIKEMVLHPANRIIISKYSCKFDMDLFLIKFQ